MLAQQAQEVVDGMTENILFFIVLLFAFDMFWFSFSTQII